MVASHIRAVFSDVVRMWVPVGDQVAVVTDPFWAREWVISQVKVFQMYAVFSSDPVRMRVLSGDHVIAQSERLRENVCTFFQVLVSQKCVA
ncbi:hypothetical protein HMPREF2902_04145 [Actinomyces sp. HMSC035G02]|nr:hypothetical protein HMPREF2902_04145 [Actinomyces sp. HMSC035G02]